MKTLIYIGIVMLFASCEKFLDIKPNQRLAIPSQLKDLQALMDDVNLISDNKGGVVGEVSADDYYLPESAWKGLSQEAHRRIYLWEKDNIFMPLSNEWMLSYRSVYSTNVVLDNIQEIIPDKTEQDQWNNIKGQAHFIRARQFFENVLVWSSIYNENTADQDLGIPLRLSQDFNIPSVRPSVRIVYRQVIDDLKQAVDLLPETPLVKTRASKPAAYGLLARVYLAMGRYDSCYHYTDLAMTINSDLIDYRTEIDPSSIQPFKQFNKEVLFDSYISHPNLYAKNARVDSSLYAMYEASDIRKTAYFTPENDGSYSFKGYYSITLFGGVATDELYLMRAECSARLGNVEQALLDLNALLEKRYIRDAFQPVKQRDPRLLLGIILEERRKELLFSGIRWMDIKRLNRDGANIKLKRVLGTTGYELLPGSPRFNLTIPEDVISQSGMPQNP
ncbi:RagB/SusD family nutrient uptake outer membrane protein [Sphingobacterium faecale]|uniref:RagB/SusD family nutrient uptake outer membrane protein n=1 Tax=Sphingobacterium faecale TaxID=2803775 RepID=A0ABS1R446_9SPHI|nr:RagB/SusD family nutrient uptake outer membrane protein [Sphingobacterium faecale]MBL1409014.1 RagB/SusD family nutrient uptake outer membrane protein [Sphingobacterium faecale]